MDEELTPWFPPTIKPVREGVYETSATESGPSFNYWDGHQWLWTCASIKATQARYLDVRSGVQDHVWRGLARKP